MMDDKFTTCITSENGFAVIRIVLDEAELLTICVAPSARGTG
ncbi:MAG: ribosomal-protein-alanine acetyltransferase, partial [Marivivens sp.]|nr:ribosomal-protein-alanine acetyltransferase [Marivivens sp.]